MKTVFGDNSGFDALLDSTDPAPEKIAANGHFRKEGLKFLH
jgi:hypothetical protein